MDIPGISILNLFTIGTLGGSLTTKLFCVEAKFSLAEIDRIRWYPGEDLDLYVRRFHKKALDCCGPVNEEFLVSLSPCHGQ